ncbi:hypothetical protein PR003_g13785 [Phytophthora rubi]|uniref:Uncharacterized protein n=1 Tax=Phytophthora rubi TaxID=129364 RepID=A0A6A3P5R7_9STRA|nr:hypothetical protein PR002_g2114 [Phytophthora rubi]KAE9050472.1 hypothetical protein PR001_g2359 [Phytophthora rubi]KAE9333917.1 hypothetical protein PR003_g13785 [Phytophthora rubi]
MQVSSLAEFQQVPRVVADSAGNVVSCQRTESVPSSPASPVTSVATADASGPP